MAKQPSAFGGSRALGYQESYFANRNDMLQSALDSVLLNYQDEMDKYKAAVALYKDASSTVQRERDRMRKLAEDLRKEQIKANQAVSQFNAGQLNSSARTGASIQATNARFNAKQAALAAYYGSQAFRTGAQGVDSVLLNEVKQAYTNAPADIGSGMTALGRQFVATTEVAKTATDRDIGRATLFQQYLGDEVRKDKYQRFPADQQLAIASGALLQTLSPEDRASVERGIVAQQQQKSRGGALAVEGGTVSSGGIPTRTVRPPDYGELIKYAESKATELEQNLQQKLPDVPEKPDLIKQQRDEYFRSFFPGYTPAYQVNEVAKQLLSLPEDRAQALLDLYRSRAPQKIIQPRMEEQVYTGFEPPKMAGDVIYGEGSPFVPPPTPDLDQARAELVARGVQKYDKVGVPKDFTALEPLDISQQSIDDALARQQELEKEQRLFEALSKNLLDAETQLANARAENDPDMIAEKQDVYDEAVKAIDTLLMSASAIREEQKVKSEIREADRPFEYPIEKRGGENVPFFRKPGGRADRREADKQAERMTREQADKQEKIDAAQEARRIYGTPEFERLASSGIGKAVTELYDANKAKGDESGKELLSYIAKEFPRVEDQRKAAIVYYGLGYGDETAGYLGEEKAKPTEDLEIGGGVISVEEAS